MAGTDLSLLRNAVDTVSSLQARGVENQAASDASGITAAGDLTESASYGTAKQIAERNATLEGIAGDIVGLQQQRRVNSTIGAQRASVAAAGFASSGSSLDILRSSVQQGYLTDQLNSVQTQINQGGFLEAGVASETERVAAENASKAALVLQQQQQAAGERATSNAASETAAIESYLKTLNPPGTKLTPQEQAEQDVVLATLKNTDGSPVKLPASADPSQTLGAITGAPGSTTPPGTPAGFGPVIRDQFGRPNGITSIQVEVK